MSLLDGMAWEKEYGIPERNNERININAFKKESGKWYSGSNRIQVPKEFHKLGVNHSYFETFIRKNCGVGYDSSFNYDIVVTQEDICEGFYMGIWK